MGNERKQQATVGIGSDHRGVQLKSEIIDYLSKKGYQIKDFGTNSSDSVDYPDYGFKVAFALRDNKIDWGILLCFTGIGMSMAANKVKGVRAALVYSKAVASYAREHNNANILVIPAGFISNNDLYKVIDIFLDTPFEGSKAENLRHKRRIDKIDQYKEDS